MKAGKIAGFFIYLMNSPPFLRSAQVRHPCSLAPP
jgi:hypothetical protein